MKYFAKYIPVEGEIKVDNIAQGESGYFYKIASIDSMNVQARSIKGELINLNKCKLVKLFICSRDIEVGDTYFIKNEDYESGPTKCDEIRSNGEIIIHWDNGNPHHTIYIEREYAYKIIGEISPDALPYVKEGDGFEECEEWYWSDTYGGRFVFKKAVMDAILWNTRVEIRVKVKCPWGCFH